MKQTQTTPTPQKERRQIPSPAALWRMWMDNLKEWRFYLEENHRQRLDISGWIDKLRLRCRTFMTSLRRDMRHQANASRHRKFPESESGLAQLFLYAAGSVPRLTSALRDRFTLHRRKQINAAHAFQKQVDKIKQHPVAFLSCALVVVALCALLSLYTIGTTAVYDGSELGTVSGIRTVNAVVSDIEDITRQTLGDEDYTVNRDKLDTTVGVVSRQVVESREEFTDNLSDELGLVEYAYVLYIDGEPVAATTFPNALEEMLDQLKKSYITANTVDSYFVENVEIKQEYTDASLVMNLGNIAEILNATKSGEVTYTVEAGDSYYYIAELYDMSVDDLLDMNPGYDPKLLRVGDVLTISNAVPYLTVVDVERQNYVQDVPYQVEYQDDNTMYQGDYKVLSPGEYGKADVTANVTYINGEETDRQVVASVTLSEPVTETQARGTIPRPTWFPTGSFRWPCSGTLTSYFGRRNTGIRGASTYHEGIDIANSYGTAIYAADGGTVSYSGWRSGFGYLVIIDHGNGYQTYYGHNSSLLVSTGEHVYKGQQIARMGSTGISSGNHCHFGIKINGTFVNPLNYL
ncbi:MAG: peptidoglycan DD-metalloendopeptidase family protein [Vescimonas sp.]